MQNSKLEEEDKSYTGNAFDEIVKEDWKSEEDYKKKIVALELQNEKYRNELYEFGQTVNKILQKTKIPQSNKTKTPNLQQQLELVRKELDNVNQFIKIYQNQINALGNKKKKDQMDSMANTQEVLKAKTQEMNNLKKELRQLTHKNKALQYKLLQYSRKNKAKSLDQQALQLKQLINENKNLKNKLEDLENMQEKKQNWLSNNMKSAKDLQKKLKEQQTRLPKIHSRGSLRQKNATASLPKLQSEKKIYTKWLQTSRGKSHSRIDKQLEDLQKINQMVQEKIKITTRQIEEIELNTEKIREKVEANQEEFVQEQVDDGPKKKDFGIMVSKKVRKVRRDWVGKFDNLRFSDSRSIRQETRIYKIIFNSSGYYQFFYYSVKDKKKTYVGKLPFDTNSLTSHGKQSAFTVDHPDFIKSIRLKINLRTQRILQMGMTSNLGVQGQFIVDSAQNASGSKPNTSKPLTSGNDQIQIYYDMDIKPNQAICCMFGSYGVKLDDKKNIVAVWLEGLGAELIQDFVEQVM